MGRRTYSEIKLVGGADYECLLEQKRTTRKKSRAKHVDANRARDRESAASNYAADPEKFRQRKRNAYGASPEKFLEKERLWRLNNPEKARAKDARDTIKRDREADRARSRTRRYGITPAQFDALKAVQHDKCGICRSDLTQSAHVDHCHKTGEVRGLLCNRCNAGLGMFCDDPRKLRLALHYLEKGAPRLVAASQYPLMLES